MWSPSRRSLSYVDGLPTLRANKFPRRLLLETSVLYAQAVMSFRARCIVLILLVGSIYEGPRAHLWATTTTCRYIGSVSEDSGKAIPGAKIRITGIEYKWQDRRLESDKRGAYVIPLLISGSNYKLEVAAPGFRTKTFDNLPCGFAVTHTLDVVLEREPPKN